MGRQVVKQPDGNFAIWSSIVDDFIMEDATKDDIKSFWVGEKVMETIAMLDKTFADIEKTGTDTWGQTYDEFLEIKESVHGGDICEDCDVIENPGCNRCLGS